MIRGLFGRKIRNNGGRGMPDFLFYFFFLICYGKHFSFAALKQSFLL